MRTENLNQRIYACFLEKLLQLIFYQSTHWITDRSLQLQLTLTRPPTHGWLESSVVESVIQSSVSQPMLVTHFLCRVTTLTSVKKSSSDPVETWQRSVDLLTFWGQFIAADVLRSVLCWQGSRWWNLSVGQQSEQSSVSVLRESSGRQQLRPRACKNVDHHINTERISFYDKEDTHF